MKKVLFLLGQLRDTDVEWMIDHGVRRKLKAGEVLIREGGRSDALYLLLDGTLAVSGTGVRGAGTVSLGCGEVVGEISFVDSRPPVATVTAAGDAIVLEIPSDRLKEQLGTDVEFALRFYRAIAMFLAYRLRNTGEMVAYDRRQPLRHDVEYEDELSPELLDSVSKAGLQFERVLRRLLAG